VARDDDDRASFRKNTLVSAMMAAFQALGIGQAAASPSTTPASPAATSSTATTGIAAATTTTTTAPTPPAAAAGANTTATTATTPTQGAPAADTLEKAVNEFAHALFSMLHRQGRSGQAEGEHDGAHSRGNEDRSSGGYNGLVQRLEQLAQSLGALPASANATSAASGTPTTTPVTQTTATTATTATTHTVPSTDTAAPAPSRVVTRLLAAFSKVLSLLQPPATATGTPTTPATGTTSTTSATSAAAGTATSTADKLKLFLTTLAQSLHSGAAAAPPSALGARLNVTA
jgi:hypothetical protein